MDIRVIGDARVSAFRVDRVSAASIDRISIKSNGEDDVKMKRGTFKILVNARCITAGADSGERKGLFNHLFGIHGNRYGYTVTHLASGRICAEANSQASAKAKCEALFALPVDWTLENPLHVISQDTRDACAKIGRLYGNKRMQCATCLGDGSVGQADEGTLAKCPDCTA